MSELSQVIKQFGLDTEGYRSEKISTGLINRTYLLEPLAKELSCKYILQELNIDVFPEPERVMENVSSLFLQINKSLQSYPNLVKTVS